MSISKGDFDIEHVDLSFMQAALERLPKSKKVVLVDWVILEDNTIVLLTLDSDNVLNVKELLPQSLKPTPFSTARQSVLAWIRLDP